MAMAATSRSSSGTREKGPSVSAPSRVIIEAVRPEIDGGRFPIKRTVGEEVVVEADIFAEGHDVVLAVLKFRCKGETVWRESPMTAKVNDVWTGVFPVEVREDYEYTVEAWVDRFASWHKELGKKAEAGHRRRQRTHRRGRARRARGPLAPRAPTPTGSRLGPRCSAASSTRPIGSKPGSTPNFST